MLRTLLGTSSASAVARISLLLVFAVGARQLEPNAFAGLLFVIGSSQLLAQFGALGWTNLITRTVPRITDNDAAMRRGFLARSFQFPSIATLLISLSLFLIGTVISSDPTLALSFQYTAFTLPFVTLCLVLRSYLIGMGRTFLGVVQSETVPMFGTVLYMVLFSAKTLESAIVCYGAAHCVAILFQSWTLSRPFRLFLQHPVSTTASKAWMTTSILTLVGFGGKLLIDRTDTLLIAPLMGMDALAQYGSVTRLSTFLMFVPTMLLPVFGPRLSLAFHAGDFHRVRRLLGAQLLIVASVLLPLDAILLISPETVLGLAFGGGYSEAAGLMPITIATQNVFALSLPFSSLMVMTKGEIRYALSSVLGCCVNFGLGVPMINAYGLMGAAVATFLGVLTMSLALLPAAISLTRRAKN